MGAETNWYVRVLKAEEHTVEVQAVTGAEAEAEALQVPGVISVKKVHHWSELCQNCGCLMPDGCGGLFEKDGESCMRNRRGK